MHMVAEGVPTARSARICAIRLAVTTPIIDEVNSILYENASPAEAKVFSSDSHENSTGTKKTIKSLALPPLICV
jgi:glycerol-3-phosphate dehydrogenase